MVRSLALAALVALSLTCGGDDDGDDGDGQGVIDGGAEEPDASQEPPVDAATGAAQGIGQFCGTEPGGGPYCETDLHCCNDNVCREMTDCPGSPGHIPCDEAADCSNVCCETEEMTFCTKPSACKAYGGTPLP
jgi:hypothetical protein